MSKVYFISGGNRGIGFTFVDQLSARDNVKVITTARDPTKATELLKLKEERKNIEVLPLDVSNEGNIDKLAELLPTVAADGIDVFISNAGIAKSFGTVLEAKRSSWIEHYKTNTLGAIFLFQTLYPYLIKKETRTVGFISSEAGSIGQFAPLSLNAYGQSKAALNYTIKESSVELAGEGFFIFALHPGVVTTDMGNGAIETVEGKALEFLKSLAITPQESVKLLLKIVDTATQEQNGKFLNYDGSEILW